jgi:hypothetical protein
MRATHLLLTLLFGLFAVGTGFAADPPRPDGPGQNSAIPPSQSDLSSKAGGAPEIERYRLPVHPDLDWAEELGSHKISPFDPVPVCYTMRTYRMKRADRNSDVTEPAGYVTCQPQSKYSVRNAVAEPSSQP